MICQREDELLDALARGYVGAELEAHVLACESCAELRNVAGALLDERVVANAEAALPTAGTMWWRMQMRHRQEAQSMARRSLLVGQAVTLAIAATLIIAIFGSQLAEEMRVAVATMRISTPMLLLIATSSLLAPIGGWMALRQK